MLRRKGGRGADARRCGEGRPSVRLVGDRRAIQLRGSGMSVRLVAILVLALLVFNACGGAERTPRRLETVAVERRDIVASAIADGVVEPLLTVEVKSKASGEIVALPVDTGDEVKTGQVLVRIDPEDARNARDQAEADLGAAVARREVAASALVRARELRRQDLIPDADMDQAVLEGSQAEAAAVKARINLDLARRRLEETTVRAPVNGTILARNVEVGTVIASAVSQVSGGTVLMTMADLSTVQVRSLVDEVDIGQVRPGMTARISVEAHPGRHFQGEVAKVEPQAVVEQGVTLFPVLVRLANPDRALRPGMNTEVEILIQRRTAVLALPVEAVNSIREATLALRLLGHDSANSGHSGARAEEARGGQAGEVSGRGRPAATVVPGPDGPHLRQIRAGLSDWEYTEVISGLEEGDKVLLLPSSSALQQEAEMKERMRRTRSLPGMEGGSRSRRRGGGE